MARMLSDTFSGIAPSSVPAFGGAQVVGGVLAVMAIRTLHPPAVVGAQPLVAPRIVEDGEALR